MEGGFVMITSLHYFTQYRDYALRTSQGRNNNPNGALYSRAQSKRATASTNAAFGTQNAPVVQLNKAYSTNVMQYIRALGENIIVLNNASKLFVADTNSMATQVGQDFGQEGHLRWIDEDLRNFANSYNNLDYLSRRAGRSPELGNLTHSIRTITQGHEPLLSHLGIITADEGGLAYHGIGQAASLEITRAAANAFQATYEASRDFLAHPMTTHMQFRELDYYYSYTIGSSPQEVYRLVESGILLDRWI